jgi:hypothetical protein
MTKTLTIGLAALALAAGLSACATPSRFEFGSYDASLYVYSKKPEQIAVFERSLEQAIARGKATGRLAPGLQAELGYCYLKDGKKDAALAQFKAEMTDFPEARQFLSKIVAQNEG